jgi:oxygen-independent coproporphyrinogen III oxidase
MNPTEATNSEPIRHLYVHFPFCARVCPYCAFYKTRGNAAEVGRFCEALVRELEQQETAALVPSTIYFGGGTPTALKTSQL